MMGRRPEAKTAETTTPRIAVIFSAEDIAGRVAALARQIGADFGADMLIVAILKGSFVFAADLVRALHHAGVRPEIDFLTLSSYGAGTEPGAIRVGQDVTSRLDGREVLLLDDILDSGRTVGFAKDLLERRGAKVRVCVLLDKRGRRDATVTADYVGFVCPNRFVVGYGLDYAHYWRELPFIGAIDGT